MKAGMCMYEQEHYKQMLKKLIDATETKRIQTTDELMRQLIDELSHKHEFS